MSNDVGYSEKTKRALREVEKQNMDLSRDNWDAMLLAIHFHLHPVTPNWKRTGFKSKEDAIKTAIKITEKVIKNMS